MLELQCTTSDKARVGGPLGQGREVQELQSTTSGKARVGARVGRLLGQGREVLELQGTTFDKARVTGASDQCSRFELSITLML